MGESERCDMGEGAGDADGAAAVGSGRDLDGDGSFPGNGGGGQVLRPLHGHDPLADVFVDPGLFGYLAAQAAENFQINKDRPRSVDPSWATDR